MEQFSGVLPLVADPEVDALVAEIDAAVRAAATDRDRFADVWRATFSLPHWYFLVQRDAADNPNLYWGTVHGQPHLVGFTTPARLRGFAVHELGVCAETDEVPTAVIPPREMLDLVEDYAARGIVGIAFDHGINGHYTPLTNLKPLWRHVFADRPEPRA